jgi:HD superfamily phosphodiesterase
VYENFLNNGEINKILANINEMHKDEIMSCHGKGHALTVVATAEKILQSFACDARTVELGKIAALLHDIGCIAGRWEHAKKSAALARVFLNDADFLSREERDVIVQAIEDHSAGKNISSAVGAALLIADKTDLSGQRILPMENLDTVHKNLLEVETIDIQVSEKNVTINYITTKKFSIDILVADFITEYQKAYTIPRKAAKYFGCDCIFKFNGVEENFSG